MFELYAPIALSALIFSVLAAVVGTWALIQVEALKRSTHQIQYVDPWKDLMEETAEGPRQEFEQLSPEKKDKLAKAMTSTDEIEGVI